MKKLLIAIAICLLAPSVGWGASYYGCANAAINADSTFCDTPTGSCTGDNPQTAATALAGTHTLYANGCTITIPEALVMTAVKLSNKDDGGAMVDGGQFTASTTGWTSTATSITAALETGSTTGAVLAVSGTGNLNPVLTIVGSITAGAASNMNGLTLTHTAGAVVITGNLTGGISNASAHGVKSSGTTGVVNVTGNATAQTGTGLYLDSTVTTGSAIITGDCIASSTAAAYVGFGCYSIGAGIIDVRGNMVAGTVCDTGAAGNITWSPPAGSNYIKITGDGTPAFYYASVAPAAASVVVGTSVVDSTDGSYDAGTAVKGGAWAQ